MISLYDLIEFARGQLFGEPAAQIFTSLSFTPQESGPNTMFVALTGDTTVDTHRHIEEAMANGASGILCARPPSIDTSGVSIVLVKDPMESLLLWVRGVLNRSKAKIVVVAGSAGKTTAVQAAHRTLSTSYKCHMALTDSADPRLSAILTVASMMPEHEIVVVRLDVARRGMFARAVKALQPHVGAVTSIHHSHLEDFNDIDEVTGEIRALATHLPPDGLLVLNYDDDRVRLISEHTQATTQTVSIDNFGATLMAYGVVEGTNGTGFDLRFNNHKYIGRWTPLLGKFQLYNVLSALLIGNHFGVSIDTGLDLLRNIEPMEGRMMPVRSAAEAFVIDDTHDATPESAAAALEWAAALKDNGQRTIFVLGDIGKLGIYSSTGHRMVGRKAAAVADFFIAQGTQASAAARAALDEGMDPRRVHITYSAHDTVKTLREHCGLSSSDLILVKGGRAAAMEEVVKALSTGESDSSALPEYGTEALYQPQRPTWVEINTEAMANNIRILKQYVGDTVTLMAVVKADAYGHGAVRTAQTALLNGAEYFGVGNLVEALELREAGIEAPILIMNYLPPYTVRQAIQHDLTTTVYDLESARFLDRAARDAGQKLRVHVKIDTGMGRLGALPTDAMNLFRHITRLDALDVEGIYTHFASADEDEVYTARQVQTFKEVIRPLRAAGFQFKYIHAANSPGILASPDNHFNMVRAGMTLHGLRVSEKYTLPQGLAPVMTWKTVVAQVKTLPPGHSVGYGCTYRTRGKETVAVICVGFADGYRRGPRHPMQVLIHGQRATVLGRVSMEKTVVNVSHIPEVAVGDEVVLIGQQGDDYISAEEMARWLETSNYEVVCSVLPRVPRR